VATLVTVDCSAGVASAVVDAAAGAVGAAGVVAIVVAMASATLVDAAAGVVAIVVAMASATLVDIAVVAAGGGASTSAATVAVLCLGALGKRGCRASPHQFRSWPALRVFARCAALVLRS